MRKNPIYKIIIRSPIRTIFWGALVLISSFLFMTMVTQSSIINKETSRIGEYYKSYGYLRSFTDINPEISKYKKIIESDPSTETSQKVKFMTGILTDPLVTNTNIGEDYDHHIFKEEPLSKDMFFYGQIISKEKVGSLYSLEISVSELTQGRMEYIPNLDESSKFHGLERINTTVYYHPLKRNSNSSGNIIETGLSIAQMDYMKNLKVGDYCYFRAAFDRTINNPEEQGIHKDYVLKFMRLRPLFKNGDPVILLKDRRHLDFEDPKYREIAALHKKHFLHTRNVLVQGVEDMDCLPSFKRDSGFYIVRGRALNKADSMRKERVCVISHELAKARNLFLNDVINIGFMRLSEEHSNNRINPYMDSPDDEYHSVDGYKIVGFYETDTKAFPDYEKKYSVYIPDTAAADLKWNDDKTFAEYYSFSLESSKYEQKFLQKYSKQFAKENISINFIPSRAKMYWSIASEIVRSSYVNLGIFFIVLLCSVLVVSQVYKAQFEQTSVISLALGMPGRRVILNNFAALFVIAPLVITGTVLGHIFGIDKASEFVLKLVSVGGHQASLIFDIAQIALVSIFIISLYVISVYILSSKIVKKPLVQLLGSGGLGLQGMAVNILGKLSRGKKSGAAESGSIIIGNFSGIEYSSLTGVLNIKTNPQYSKITVFRYNLRVFFRKLLDPITLILMAFVVAASLNYVSQVIEKNQTKIDYLYSNTPIYGEVFYNQNIFYENLGGGIADVELDKVREENIADGFELIGDVIYERLIYNVGTKDEYEKRVYAGVKSVNQDLTDKEKIGVIGLEMMKDYELSDLNSTLTYEDYKSKGEPFPILVGRKFAEDNNLQLGAVVRLTNYPIIIGFRQHNVRDRALWRWQQKVVGFYDKIYDVKEDKWRFESDTVLFPFNAMKSLEARDARGIYYSKAKVLFDKTQNTRLADIAGQITDKFSNNIYNETLHMIIWDDEFRSVVNPLESTLQTLKILYPFFVAAGFLLMMVSCFLLAAKNNESTALFRMLGVKKFTIYINMVVLNAICILAAYGIYALLHGTDIYFINLAVPALGAFLGLSIAAAMILSVNPLDLLQMKE